MQVLAKGTSWVCARALIAAAMVAAGPANGLNAQLSSRAAGTPGLVVFITIDQMRYDYLEKFAGQYR